VCVCEREACVRVCVFVCGDRGVGKDIKAIKSPFYQRLKYFYVYFLNKFIRKIT